MVSPDKFMYFVDYIIPSQLTAWVRWWWWICVVVIILFYLAQRDKRYLKRENFFCGPKIPFPGILKLPADFLPREVNAEFSILNTPFSLFSGSPLADNVSIE